MKFHTIANSGKRLKDFINLYFLLEYFSIKEMAGFYSLKHPNFNQFIALKAIGYFGNIDTVIDPTNKKINYRWLK